MYADPLSSTFTALADPTRRAILARLAQGDLSVKDLSAPFSISAPAITKHLKVLEQAGLISRSRSAQLRPCHLESAPLEAAAQYIENYRQLWEDRFSQLDQYLDALQTPKGKKKKNARK